MKLMLSAAVFAVCLISAETAIGLITPPPHPRNQAIPALEYPYNNSGAVVLRGTVKKFAESTALFTDTAIYPLIGGDFATIVGRKVNIIGEMVVDNDLRKIAVARVQCDRRSL